jgi:hypothetical protein
MNQTGLYKILKDAQAEDSAYLNAAVYGRASSRDFRAQWGLGQVWEHRDTLG